MAYFGPGMLRQHPGTCYEMSTPRSLFLGLLCLSICQCGPGNRDRADPRSVFESTIGPIPGGVSPIEARITNLGNGDMTFWVVFDCTDQAWKALASAKSLRKTATSLDVAGATCAVGDTGFEAFLGADSTAYCESQDPRRIYFPQRAGRGYRVVFLFREW